MPDFTTLSSKPAVNAASVTPDDANDLAIIPTRGLYVGASGAVKVTMWDGGVVTFTALAAGIAHPIAAKRVWSTGTDATGIIALY